MLATHLATKTADAVITPTTDKIEGYGSEINVSVGFSWNYISIIITCVEFTNTEHMYGNTKYIIIRVVQDDKIKV